MSRKCCTFAAAKVIRRCYRQRNSGNILIAFINVVCGLIYIMSKVKSDILHVKGINVGIYTEDFRNEYISLTDIARFRNSDDPRFAIQNWMRNRNTLEFLGLWESLHNPNFNRVQFDTFRSEAGLNRFVMTPSKWIESTGAISFSIKCN